MPGNQIINPKNKFAEKLSDQQITNSWFKNAKPWIKAIDHNEIVSRVEVTNEAVIKVIIELNLTFCSGNAIGRDVGNRAIKLLDLGCGEGWLIRALNKALSQMSSKPQLDFDMLGLDVVPELITSAAEKGIGRFNTMSYEALSYEALQEKFDVIVCNFSLLGEESVTRIFGQVRHLLSDNGVFVVQTLHPVTACGDSPYLDGWRSGSWQGFNDSFIDPPPWYFRTLDSWLALFADNGLVAPNIIEPKSNINNQPLSVIFVAGVAKNRL